MNWKDVGTVTVVDTDGKVILAELVLVLAVLVLAVLVLAAAGMKGIVVATVVVGLLGMGTSGMIGEIGTTGVGRKDVIDITGDGLITLLLLLLLPLLLVARLGMIIRRGSAIL